MKEHAISAEVVPAPGQANRAALALQRLGFRVLHMGPTISVQGPQPLWSSVFDVSFKPRKKKAVAGVNGTEVSYQQAQKEKLRMPQELQSLIEDVMFAEPPEFY
jgi:hypothetical protein